MVEHLLKIKPVLAFSAHADHWATVGAPSRWPEAFGGQCYHTENAVLEGVDGTASIRQVREDFCGC